MTELTVLNSNFEARDKVSADIDLSPSVINEPVVHQVVKAILASRRQGNASTKTRGEVRGGGRKPYKQKGTGRARQGSTRSPVLVGGGTMFGPKPRCYEQKINKRMMIQAIHAVLADKYQAGKLTIVESLESNGKTKQLHEALNSKGLLPALIVANDKNSLAIRAGRNLQFGKAMPVEGFSVYEAVKYENLIIEKEALETLLKRLV